MPTTIKNFLPIHATTPQPLVEPRPRERRDDFQQHLDEAAIAKKPAEPVKAPTKSTKAASKKPAGKATTSGKAKPKADRDDDHAAGAAEDGTVTESPVSETRDGHPLTEADAGAI